MTMLRRFLLGLCLSLSLIGYAQVVPLPPPPPPAKPADKIDYSQEGYVVEKWYTTYTFENDGTGTREFYARVKVQSEAGVQQWGQVVLGYSSANERVEIPYVRVLKSDGATITASTDAIQDLSTPVEKEAPLYSDFRQKHVTVPGLRPGDTLEYSVLVHQTPLAPGQFWVEHRFFKTGIVLEEKLQINVPRDRQVKLKTEIGSDAIISDDGNRRTYNWTSSHRERDDDDDKSKKKARKRKEPDQPPVQMTTFATWEEMGKWYGDLERDRRQPTPEIQAKAKELIAGKTTDLAKIEALYNFVATNFRYISLSFGVGRYQPHPAPDVLHNSYGDCKDKHTLLAALLEASGYHTSSVLINTTRKLDPDVPSPSQFDHVISMVPLDKEEVWMDSTAEVAPFRMLSPAIRKKQALVIPPSGAPHLEETPADPPFPNREEQTFEGKVNDFGKLTAHVTMTSRGDSELFVRQLFRRIPNADWQRMVARISALEGLEGDVTNVKIGDPVATDVPLHLEYQVVVNNFYDWAKKKADISLPLSQLNLVDANEDNTDSANDAIEFGSPTEYTYHFQIEFPAKYSVRPPLPFSMKRDYAQYDVAYKVDGTVFTAERKLNTFVRELPAARVSDYAAFRRAVFTDIAQRISVDSTAAAMPATLADLKGDDLMDAANAALERQNFQVAVDLFKRVLDADPKSKTAWVSLGRAYMGLRDTGHAIDAFRKQAEMNPYDEYAFNSLGWAYTTDRKYDEAVAAYQKAIEINPLSFYAHAALGGTYSEAHQYEKAVPEMEKAVSLRPNDAFLHVNLGDAYLNAGQDDKALAAFDHAIELSDSPGVRNNIAYQLSLKSAHLDRAQQYADSAVDATVIASRNLTLDQLTERDLGVVQSLAAYWDTLGWVLFQQGNIEKAEKYVESAWSLDQHTDVADHLGQIYEKQGRKEDALRAYAMAVASPRPTAETRARLVSAAGSEKKADTAVERNRDTLSSIRTVTFSKAAKNDGTADFFVLFSNNGSGVTVDGVKFITGDESLKIFSEALRTAKYNVPFPDNAPARILRRGVLSCSKLTGDCKFTMLLPQDVRSVN